MLQRMLKWDMDTDRRGPYYYVQAVSESTSSKIMFGHTLFAVVRGLPVGSHCYPIKANCILGVQQDLLEVVGRSGIIHEHDIHSTILDVVIATIPHYVTRRPGTKDDSNGQQVYNMFTDRDGRVPHLLRPLPSNVVQVDELVFTGVLARELL
jgi:hypothetical protein